MNIRKAKVRDRIVGVYEILIELIVNFFNMNFEHVNFIWMLIKLTIKGDFEVIEK